MRNLVIGAGSIGTRHIRNLISLGHDVIAFDTSQKAVDKIKDEFQIHAFTILEDCFADLDDSTTAFICTPADSHIEYAKICAQQKMDLFIEKPLAASLDGIEDLIKIVNGNNLISMVGCNMRFDPGLEKLNELLKKKAIGQVYSISVEFGYDLSRWRKGVDYRHDYAVKKSQGGGVILDCIHELDYVCWLLESLPVEFKVTGGHISDLEIETEDIALIICKFANDVFGQVHVDYLQNSYYRACKVRGIEGALYWCFSPEKVSLTLITEGQRINCLDESMPFDVNDMYIKELKYFLDCRSRRIQPFNTVKQSKEVLNWAVSIRDELCNQQNRGE